MDSHYLVNAEEIAIFQFELLTIGFSDSKSLPDSRNTMSEIVFALKVAVIEVAAFGGERYHESPFLVSDGIFC